MTQPNVLRALRKQAWVLKNGKVGLDAFDPDSRTEAERRERNAEPPGSETSINWEDDGGALAQLFGNANATVAGVARVPAAAVAEVEADYTGWVVVERQPLTDNAYHGNVVFVSGIENQMKRTIQAVLAHAAQCLPRPDP